MIVFLIGPSGVGKTTLTKKYKDEFGDAVEVINLDSRVEEVAGRKLREIYSGSDGKTEFWNIAVGILTDLVTQYDESPILCICDCGVGVLHTAEGRKYFHNNRWTIALTASPQAAFQRRLQKPAKSPSYDKFLKLEYGGLRKDVYDSLLPNIIDIADFNLDDPRAYDKFKTELIQCIYRMKNGNE